MERFLLKPVNRRVLLVGSAAFFCVGNLLNGLGLRAERARFHCHTCDEKILTEFENKIIETEIQLEDGNKLFEDTYKETIVEYNKLIKAEKKNKLTINFNFFRSSKE